MEPLCPLEAHGPSEHGSHFLAREVRHRADSVGSPVRGCSAFSLPARPPPLSYQNSPFLLRLLPLNPLTYFVLLPRPLLTLLSWEVLKKKKTFGYLVMVILKYIFFIFFRPFWLSPRQVMVIPVGPTCEKYALQVKPSRRKRGL